MSLVKTLGGYSQTKGHGLKLVDLALKSKAQVLPEVWVDRDMEEGIFQVQRCSPVHGPNEISDFERRFQHEGVEHFEIYDRSPGALFYNTRKTWRM